MVGGSVFFSVIIPTCNRPVELKRAVASVLGQSFTDFEIIIVNNGEGELDLPFSDNRIKIFVEKRKGANYARNTGIENSIGEFICFLDDDDEYLENHLKVLHQLIVRKNKAEALYRTFTRTGRVNEEYKDQPVKLKGKEVTPIEHIYTTLLVMHCVCCHRNIFKKFKFDPSVPVAQDYHLWSRILVSYPLIEAPVITTIYHKSGNSISSPGKTKYLDYIRVYRSLFDNCAIRSQLPGKIINDRLYNYHFWLLSEFKKELTLREYFGAVCKMIFYKPEILFGKALYSILIKK